MYIVVMIGRQTGRQTGIQLARKLILHIHMYTCTYHFTIGNRGQFDDGVKWDLDVGQFFHGVVHEVGHNTPHDRLDEAENTCNVHAHKA